jgi:hypothetical protein
MEWEPASTVPLPLPLMGVAVTTGFGAVHGSAKTLAHCEEGDVDDVICVDGVNATQRCVFHIRVSTLISSWNSLTSAVK